MKKQNGEITIKDILNIFLPKMWFIILIAVICAASLGAVATMQKDTYTSTSLFIMTKVPMSTSESTNTGLNSGEIEAMRSMVNSSKKILSSKTFGRSVRDKLVGYENVTVDDIRSMLSISLLDEDTADFMVSTKTGDPELSKDVANIVHQLLPEEIEALPYAIKVEEIELPEVATSPDDKGVTKNAVIGFAVGVVISALLVFVYAHFDVVIRRREKIEESCSIPILGVIPRLELDD